MSVDRQALIGRWVQVQVDGLIGPTARSRMSSESSKPVTTPGCRCANRTASPTTSRPIRSAQWWTSRCRDPPWKTRCCGPARPQKNRAIY